MDGVSRRSTLRSGIAAAASIFAGCADGNPPVTDSTPTREEGVAVTTPVLDECEVAQRPNPTPSDEGVVPREYPTYPDSLTAESAASFAIEYERSYRHNELLTGGDGGTDTIIVNAGIPSNFLIERRNGFLLGVTGTVDTEDNRTPDGGTAAPAYSDEFAVWYLLTDPIALRRSNLEAKDFPETPPESVDLSEAAVLHCGQ